MSSAPYRLVNGTVKIQIEDILGTKPGGGWVYQAPGVGNAGAEGAHYYYKSQTAEGSHKTVPDAGRFTVSLDIAEAGVYGILLRASRDTANPGDARNDIWIKVDGSTEAAMPAGTPTLTTSAGFAKFKSAPPAGKWIDAKTFSTPAHDDNNAPSDVMLGVGTHTITFAPRSTGYHIDSLKVVARSLLPTPPDPKPEPEPEPVTVRARVATGADDFETLHGAANNDLDFGKVGGKANTVGLRFTGLEIAEGAEIESAYFVFASNAAASGGRLDIEIQNGLGARDFVKGSWIDSRAWLDDSVAWTPGAWQKGATYRSADVSDLIEALLAGGGLDAADALGFRITGTGTRSAHAFEGNGASPELVVTWLEA